MFHFSTDRLAGLDAPILKITAPPKVPMLIPNYALYDDMHFHVQKLKKQKQKHPPESRTPLADRTASNNLVCNSTTPVHTPVHLSLKAHRPLPPTSTMLLHALSTPGEQSLDIPSSRVSAPCSPDIVSFRPLPPVPSASTLQLPSFLNFSSQSFTSRKDLPPRRSATSLPASVLFRLSSSPVSSRRVVIRKTKNNKVFEGPQWIPAFHHPNSPYVPWPAPVRRRILPSPSPISPSPICTSSPCTRSGAVAPEPWASSTLTHNHPTLGKERLSSSWKSFKNTIKKGIKTVVAHIRKPVKSLCTSKDMLRIYHDTTSANMNPHAVPSTRVKAHNRGSRDSLSSFASSDSATLATWLAQRRAATSGATDSTPREMSLEEYELVGSWLDFRQCDEEWVCGVQDCDMHTAGGSPYAASEYPIGLRTAMPLDFAEMLSEMHSSPVVPPQPFPIEPFSASPRFHSWPRLARQSFDIYSVQEAKLATPNNAERCLPRCRELSMPSGWTFN